MPIDNNVIPFGRPVTNQVRTDDGPVPTATTPDELREAIEAMTPEQFDTFDSVVQFANFLLDNKLNIKHFVACVGRPGPDNETSFTIASSGMEAGDFAMSIRMLDRQLDKMIG